MERRRLDRLWNRRRSCAGMCEGNIVPGNLARPRIQEIYACMNRYRKLGTDRKERG